MFARKPLSGVTTLLIVWPTAVWASVLSVRVGGGVKGLDQSLPFFWPPRPRTSAFPSPETTVVVISVTSTLTPTLYFSTQTSLVQTVHSASRSVDLVSEPTSTTDMPSISSPITSSASTSSPLPAGTQDTGNSALGSNRTLVITLSTVLSVIGVLLVLGAVLLCLRYRRRRLPFFARGISPIDDDEIATWKLARAEKIHAAASVTVPPATGKNMGHEKHASTSSAKKPPSVIIYQDRHSQQDDRRSGEVSPRSFTSPSCGALERTSLDRRLPQAAIHAIAPNARAGLTDAAIPGDEPFLVFPRRHPSRLSKPPPTASPRSVRSHGRSRSSRSSIRSFDYGYCAGSDMEVSPRASHEFLNSRGRSRSYSQSQHQPHTRLYSSSSIPPRLSFSDDVVAGGLSPRPFFPADSEIGRAIG
ncbi:hypothetical protein VTK73DRAFT_7941 [Phialemonium thermophilum]|uniref:Uncharacterized protein n=1 Tax=Phialemonium thermophilum TaxID=223376 RepID=A0ABR3XR87_9PEZI